jgi:hypothetical protein
MKNIARASLVLVVLVIALQWESAPPESSAVNVLPRQGAVATLPVRRLSADRNWMGNSPEEIAHRYVETNREAWGIQPHHDLRAEVLENPLGTQVRYKVFQGEYELIGMEIQLRVTRGLEVKNVEMQYRPVGEADLNQPVLAPEQIESTIENRFEKVAEGVAPVLYVPRDGSVPVPAFAMTVKRKTGSQASVQAIFRASDGQVLDLTVPRAEF